MAHVAVLTPARWSPVTGVPWPDLLIGSLRTALYRPLTAASVDCRPNHCRWRAHPRLAPHRRISPSVLATNCYCDSNRYTETAGIRGGCLTLSTRTARIVDRCLSVSLRGRTSVFVHKLRNVLDHLPERQRTWVKAILGVVARIVTGPHDANRQDPHRPMRYDTGRPRAVIRLRISQPMTSSLPCPAGLRARKPSPMMDLYRKNVFSTRP